MIKTAETYEALFVSTPKSGRTWHRVLLGYYLSRMADCDPRYSLDVEFMATRARFKLFAYSHNGSEYSARFPLKSKLIASSLEWRNRDVLLIVRDLADTLVSAFHHAKFRDQGFSGEISDFIRAENTGVDKMLVALNRWHENRHLARSFEVLSYEQMHRDTASALRQTLKVLGVTEPNEQWIEEAIAFSSIENMRRYEDENFFNFYAVKKETDDQRGRKVRDGKIGGSEKLSAEDRRYIAHRTSAIGNPFADYTTKD
jgi:hypothetical protein